MDSFQESFKSSKQKVNEIIPEELSLQKIISNLLSSNPTQLKSSALSFLGSSKDKLESAKSSIASSFSASNSEKIPSDLILACIIELTKTPYKSSQELDEMTENLLIFTSNNINAKFVKSLVSFYYINIIFSL